MGVDNGVQMPTGFDVIPKIPLGNTIKYDSVPELNPPTPRRKYEAATHSGDDSISNRNKGDREARR